MSPTKNEGELRTQMVLKAVPAPLVTSVVVLLITIL